ncbi:Coatomer delta subunit [Tieghemostelium lacteum]|uniref:Coatomer subunit delta n=1 Tax=Tieghemostelium lacteum TaxID=361077 RepID=A0A152A5R0_TIELA|nr:Coatomer delta subunit [Tieghemostelium lacteum]|eukprot:KYR01566.1 Coatomer delta subunit [Tieghemostelium lacteum]
MVVLSAAICTKNGKALLSRQFSEMTKSRVEGLISAFPKLIGTGKQHTFIETENIRYVYQPLESLYLLLITNKNSNILEDLETLHLLAKLVAEYSSFDESDILKNAFELIFTFDEVIVMGYKERATVQQIKHSISMESHEEDMAKRELLSRESEVKQQAQKKIKEIEKFRQEQIMRGGSGMMRGGIGGGGIGSPLYAGDNSSGGYPPQGGSSGYKPSSSSSSSPSTSKPDTKAPPSKAGMQLSKSTKKSAIAQVLKEEKIVEKVEDAEQLLSSTNDENVQEDKNEEPQEGVHVTVQEIYTAQVENDGGIENIDIRGGLSVDINDQALGKIELKLTLPKVFGYQTHPQIDKAAFGKSLLKLREDVSQFPSGGILKWRLKTKDDEWLPIKVNCWPSPSKGSTTVNLEYECQSKNEFKQVVIAIPNPTTTQPIVNRFDGLYEYDSKQKLILWKIPIIDDSNRQGSMEFTVKAATSEFFPVKVDFKSSQTLCDLSIDKVLLESNQQPTPYSKSVSLTVDNYEIN